MTAKSRRGDPQVPAIWAYLGLLPTIYTLTEAKMRAAEMVKEARHANEPVLITDAGEPVAVLISPRLLAHYLALEDASLRAARGEGEGSAGEQGIERSAVLDEWSI